MYVDFIKLSNPLSFIPNSSKNNSFSSSSNSDISLSIFAHISITSALSFNAYSLTKLVYSFSLPISFSFMFAKYIIGLLVNKLKGFIIFSSSFVNFNLLTGISLVSASFITFNIASSCNASLSFVVCAFFSIFDILFCTISKSARVNSIFIISISLIGSAFPSTCIMLLSLKHLTTSHIASTSLICDKNLFPNPSPFDAPFTNPAISVNSNVVSINFFGLYISFNTFNLLSGTVTIPTFGSIVANG